VHHVDYVCSLFDVKMELKINYPPERPYINPLNAELIPICHLLALLRAHHILRVSSIKANYQLDALTIIYS